MSIQVSRKQEIARRFSQAAPGYASHAALQQAIADRLLQQARPAGVVLDAGCGRGRESLRLAQRPGVEKVIALDLAPAMLAALPAHENITPLLGDMEAVPLPAATVDGVFSSFAMQWCESPARVALEMARVLKPGGWLWASVPGPGSLAALRREKRLHVNDFASADDWTAALRQAGFGQCEWMREEVVAHFSSVRELLAALKGIGANTADAPRENHLHGRGWWQAVTQSLEAAREPAGLPLRYEVLFMQAIRES